MHHLFSLENKTARRFWLVVFFICFFVELWMISWSLHNKVRHVLNPVLWLTAGVGSAIVGGWLAAQYPTVFFKKTARPAPPANRWIKPVLVWASFLLGILFASHYLREVYHDIPEFSDLSDILPAKKEYVRRFFAGEIVYRPVPFSTYDLAATYLPTRWLPFVFADLLKFDYRWISFSGMVVSVFFWVKSAISNPNFGSH